MNHPSATKPETFMLSKEQIECLPVEAKQALEQVDDLKYFLATAPANWQVDQIIRRYLLPTGEYVSCVLWRNLFHVTGTDIVRALTYRFLAFGRPISNCKKFEEGIFSDLRNLKPGTDASLEEPKSAFLDLLYTNNCIRTKKKQKVFYWFSVPHDRLFLDALERDLKRERMGAEATTVAVSEPALSFVFDASQSLYDQLTKSLQNNAAAEVGASLAAQQAQHNLMAAQFQGSLPGYHAGDSFSSMGGQTPSESYQRRSQSIQSAVPLDYSSHMAEASQPLLHAPGMRITGEHAGHRSYRSGSMQMNQALDMQFSNPYHLQPEYDSETTSDSDRRTFAYDTPQLPTRVLPHHAGYRSGHSPEFNVDDFQVSSRLPSISYDTMTDLASEMDNQDHMTFPSDNIHGSLKNFQHFGDMSSASPVGLINRGMPANFNMFEGSSTYKQRRRRQSAPISNLQIESLARNQTTRTHARAVTEPHGLMRYHPPPTRHEREVSPMQTSFEIDNSAEHDLEYQYDAEIAELERTTSCGGSDTEAGSPYPNKTYICPVQSCSRIFRRLEHIKRHVRSHTHERPYFCDLCDKRFSRSDNLAQHRKTHERRGSSSSGELPTFSDPFSFDSQAPSQLATQQSDMPHENSEEPFDHQAEEDKVAELSNTPEHPAQQTHVPGDYGSILDGDHEEAQSMMNFDLEKFRSSLNPRVANAENARRTQRHDMTLAGAYSQEHSAEPYRRDDPHSQAYLPSTMMLTSRDEAAPRTFIDYSANNWHDDEITPRQENFILHSPNVRAGEAKE